MDIQQWAVDFSNNLEIFVNNLNLEEHICKVQILINYSLWMITQNIYMQADSIYPGNYANIFFKNHNVDNEIVKIWKYKKNFFSQFF